MGTALFEIKVPFGILGVHLQLQQYNIRIPENIPIFLFIVNKHFYFSFK